MHALTLRSFVVPAVAVFGLASGLAFAQTKPDTQAAGGMTATARTADGKSSPTRDWSQVDANGDDSVSAAEMEAYLKAYPGPLAKK